MKKNQKSRREGALERLQDQIKTNTKSDNEGSQTPLNESDKKRIGREIDTLKKRISK